MAGKHVRGASHIRTRMTISKKEMIDGVFAALVKGAEKIRGDAVLMITTDPKTGKKYGNHTASAPGETPTADTGHLHQSIEVDGDRDLLEAYVTVNANYGLALELGTKNIAERPFMRPAVQRNESTIAQLVSKELDKGKRKVRYGPR